MDNDTLARLQAKTPQQRLLSVLENEFHMAPRIAQAVLAEAIDCLSGLAEQVRPGQMRVLLVQRKAGPGQPLRALVPTEVLWTVDAGAEDREVLLGYGQRALRQLRIERLLDEALAQGAAATQEDLAQALQVSLRTIKRDCAHLTAQGTYLPLRGNLHGIGRGQTHKAQIIRRWLRGETYDQIALHVHHCARSIQRYVQTFVRVVALHQQGYTESQLALLVQIGEPLVQEYLAVYRQHAAPEYQERLAAHLARLTAAAEPAAKKGAV